MLNPSNSVLLKEFNDYLQEEEGVDSVQAQRKASTIRNLIENTESDYRVLNRDEKINLIKNRLDTVYQDRGEVTSNGISPLLGTLRKFEQVVLDEGTDLDDVTMETFRSICSYPILSGTRGKSLPSRKAVSIAPQVDTNELAFRALMSQPWTSASKKAALKILLGV